MIEYIDISKHKALKHAQLLNLGHLNIICGKNNSGKSTILEALTIENKYGLGKKVVDVEWLVKSFEPNANRYTSPDPQKSLGWLRGYLQKLSNEGTIWYSNEKDEIIGNIFKAKANDQYVKGFSNDIFDFTGLIKEFFRKPNEFFTPVLIPPKRHIEFKNQIVLNQQVTPEGEGIINRLFFLKNQDLESDEYKIYKSIYDIFFEITKTRFNIVPDQSNQLTLTYKTGDQWIPANDCGLGLSDVLVIISIINILDKNVVLLEEPENHLHAEYQKRLLNYLVGKKAKQFFITTHSPVFLDSGVVSKIFFCSNDTEIVVSDQTSKSAIISSLGFSVAENLVADLLILVEGPYDIPVIQEMLNWLDIDSTLNIRFWPLGGDIMASLDLSVFAERRNVFALVDSDPGSSVQRTRFENNCQKNGILCLRLARYSIENYFTIDAIREIFPRRIPSSVRELSHDQSVDEQIGFKEKGNSIKAKNSQIVKHMRIENIEGTDLHQFLLKIKDYVTSL